MTLKEINTKHNITCDDPDCEYCPAYKADLEKLIEKSVKKAIMVTLNALEPKGVSKEKMAELYWEINKHIILG
jgi:hypothetical protein